MVTSRHRRDDSRIFGLEARSLAAYGYTVVWVGPGKGVMPEQELVRFRPFVASATGLSRLILLFRALRRTRARVYHCHEPDAAVLALIVGKARGANVIFDAHEFYRALARDRAPRYFKDLASLLYFIMEVVLYRLCDQLITVSEGVAQEMAKAISPGKITIVANCSGPEVFHDRAPALSPCELRILHLGTASSYHQIAEMLEAFRRVREEVPNAEFLQIGRVPEEDLANVRQFLVTHGIEHAFHHFPRVPFEELGAYIPCARVGLIARKADANASLGIPTKLFDYMSFGVPVVATDLAGIRRVNDKYHAATLVDTSSPAAIAEAVLAIHGDEQRRLAYSENGRAAVREEYSWQRMQARLIHVYETKLSCRPTWSEV